MVRTIIEAFPKEKKVVNITQPNLRVAECFTETIQGEGINIGHPATFLRLQSCTLSCMWCDTTEVWRQGNPYTIKELYKIFEDNNVFVNLVKGHHLILTGGSPLLQQKSLLEFIKFIENKYKFRPKIEIENECVLMPDKDLCQYVHTWNNSPKLSNSGMKKEFRHKPDVIRYTGKLNNSWFKFVISKEDDWNEIEEDFLNFDLIKRNQIILMPEGQTQEELNQKREMVVNLAIKNNVRFTDRLHITIFNKKVGV